MFKKFFGNTRKPEGLGGKIMLKMMNSGHSKVAKWGFSHIATKDDHDILDIGCGGGANIKIWLETCKNGRVTGIDYSPESVKKSKALNAEAIEAGRCEVIEANVLDMPFENESFDIVSAFETVYFWPEIDKAFSSVYNLLKPEGRFMIVNEARDSRADFWVDMIGGMKVYTEEDLKNLLTNAGFKVTLVDSPDKKPWIVVIGEKEA